MDSSTGRSSPPPSSSSEPHTIAFPAFETPSTSQSTTVAPSRQRSRSNALSADALPPSLLELNTPSRRNSTDSIGSTSSASSGYNSELERLRNLVAQNEQEVEESALGLGISRESTETKGESEAFNYRGVQSSRQGKFKSNQLRLYSMLTVPKLSPDQQDVNRFQLSIILLLPI